MRYKQSKTRQRTAAALIALIALTALALIWQSLPPGAAKDGRSLAQGSEVTVVVSASAVQNLYGYEFKLLYDGSALEYTGGLESEITAIPTIFARTDRGDFLLVGATMIGDKNGFDGQDVVVCQMVFRAVADIDLDDVRLSIDDVNLVQGDDYNLDVTGWTVSIK
jgi:hypothetical protein